MADTLIIDPSGVNLIVPCQRAGKAPKRRVGDISTSYSGARSSHIREELEVIPIVFVNSTPAICRQVESIFALGAQVECSGTVFNREDAGTSVIVCDGEYTDDMEQGGPWRVPGITLYQVSSAGVGMGGFGAGTPGGVGGFPAGVSPDDPVTSDPGGGCDGTGPILSSPMSDDFDCGTSIDTLGDRFAGANGWTTTGIGPTFLATVQTGGQLLYTMSSNGFDWHPKGAYQALPVGDWTFETQCGLLTSSFGAAVGILLVESGTGKQFAAHFFDNFSAYVGAGSELGLGAYGYTASPGLAGKLEVRRLSGNLRMRYDVGSGWVTLVASLPQTTPFATGPDQIWVFAAPRRFAGDDTSYFDYFYRTA